MSRLTRSPMSLLAGLFVLATAGTAFAAHDHYIDTPGTLKDNIGSGQTGISDSDHGGYHKIHDNVHVGTPGSGETPSGARSGVGTKNEKNPVTIGKTSDLP